MTNFTTLPPSTQSSTNRRRGRPPQSNVEQLRAAITFTELKRVSGLKLANLQREFAQKTQSYLSDSIHDSTPVAFLRYGRGKQVPKPCVYDWLRREWPDVYKISQSPFFKVLAIPSEREALTQFASELYGWGESGLARDLIFTSLTKSAIGSLLRIRTPIWLHPRDIVGLAHRAEVDALCLIIHCLKVNERTTSELECAKVAIAWLQKWWTSEHAHVDAKELMVTVLRDKVAGLQTVLAADSDWRSMAIDLNEECYQHTSFIGRSW